MWKQNATDLRFASLEEILESCGFILLYWFISILFFTLFIDSSLQDSTLNSIEFRPFNIRIKLRITKLLYYKKTPLPSSTLGNIHKNTHDSTFFVVPKKILVHIFVFVRFVASKIRAIATQQRKYSGVCETIARGNQIRRLLCVCLVSKCGNFHRRSVFVCACWIVHTYRFICWMSSFNFIHTGFHIQIDWNFEVVQVIFRSSCWWHWKTCVNCMIQDTKLCIKFLKKVG